MSTDTQIVLVDGKSLTKRSMFDEIDNVIVQLNHTNDINKATNVINGLGEIEKISGVAKAKLLWGMEIWWRKNKTEDFADHILSTTSIQNRKTVLEYVNVWEHIEQELIPKKVQEKPMRELVPIANMLVQGFEPSKAEWSEISLSSNSSDLGEIIRKIKGKKPRKSARMNTMERDGSLYTWKNNKRKYFGFLDIKEAETDEDVAEAIEQTLSGRPITRK